MEKYLTKRNTVIAIGLITLVKVYLSATLQLHPDEAYYWLWSRRLDIGYYDHSPMVGYFIWLTTLFSQAEFWVRLSGIITSLLISVLAWLLTMQLFGEVVIAAASVLLINLYPMNLTGSIIITPDIPAMLFWAAGVYALWQIPRTGKAAWWYILGIAFGLSLLSKYTAVLLAPCVFLFLLLTDERKWFKTVHPYLAFILGMSFFLPVVLWNRAHDWISFRFQMGHGLGGQSYSIGRVIEYFGGQLLVAGPFALIAGLIAASAALFTKDKKKLFLMCTSLPVILFFAFSSLKKLAGPNWPAFAYVTFGIVTAKYLFEGRAWRRWLWGLVIGFNLLLTAVVILHTSFNIIPLARYSKDMAIADATNWFYGYRELGREIKEKFPDTKIIMTQSHQLSAQIIYYTGDTIFTTTDKKITRISQFDFWPAPAGINGAKGLYIYVASDDPGPYGEYFSECGQPHVLTILRSGFPIRSYKMIPCSGYRGQPPVPAS